MRFFIQFVLFLSVIVSPSNVKADFNMQEWVIAHADKLQQSEAPLPNDLAKNLVDHFSYDNLTMMEKQNLLAAKLSDSPWSGYYWPTSAGLIANRYNDPQYQISSWRDNAAYLNKVLGTGNANELSPAEKYDTLIGDSNFQLTKQMIQGGAPYADASGNVESWFGICHGWAPASMMLPRPSHSVSVRAVNGTIVDFTPSDLKALASLLWANAAGKTRYVSGRCEEQNPASDPSGRTKNPDCRDTNPATWHLAVVNQIGVAKRSFVIDIQSASDVWNQPVFGYQYNYVNPVTGVVSNKLADAKVAISNYSNDKYAAHRSPNTRFIVNIEMTLDYLSETRPSSTTSDQASDDSHMNAYYQYDLELDGQDKIVGGEWHTSQHPDFLWVPVVGSKAASEGDIWLDGQHDLSIWNGSTAIPSRWQDAAKMATEAAQPLAKVVEELMKLSNQ